MGTVRYGYEAFPVYTRYHASILLHAARHNALAAGADSLWIPDHLNGFFPPSLATPDRAGLVRLAPDPDAFFEPWTSMGALAARNRFRRIPLGIGVTDAGRRNPAVTAQAAATVHHLNRGGAILGIGTGEREGNEPYGVDWSKPVGRFEEAIATIRALWDSGGEPISRDSAFFPLHNAKFAIPPKKGRWPQIWIAAHGPRMLRITGRYADAWYPASPQTPQQYAGRLEIVRTAASNAGRNPDAITPAIWLPVLTGRSRDEVEEVLDSDLARWWAVLASDSEWQRHGVTHPLGEGFGGGQDIVPQSLDEETVERCIKLAPPALIRESLLYGTPAELVDQVSEWRDHGVRYVVVQSANALRPSLIRGLMAEPSLIRFMRGLRRL